MSRPNNSITRCPVCDMHMDVDRATGYTHCINRDCAQRGAYRPPQVGMPLYSERGRYRRIKARRMLDERGAP